jgi:type IV pilus assembly protein PilE
MKGQGMKLSTYRSSGRPGPAGFTLIELLMVLVIMGVLTALALPSYTRHVQRGNRAEAMAALMEAQHFMERYYSANGRYTGSAGSLPVLPARLQDVPTATAARYRLSLGSAAVNAYVLQAEPVGTMAGDVCGTLTLNQTGQRGLADSAASVAECWR